MKQPPFYQKLAMVLVALIALVYIAVLGKEVLSPLIFSFLFAILLYPLCRFFEKRCKLPRGLASILSVIVFLGIILGIFYLLGTQFRSLSEDWPQFKEQVIYAIDSSQDWVAKTFNIDRSHQLNYLTDAAKKLLSSSTVVIGATVLSISSILLFLVFTFIYTFFILLYRTLIVDFLTAVFKEKHLNIVHEVLEQVQYIIRKYLIGLMIQIVIVSTITCLVLWLIGIKYAFLLGLLTGIINIIPYIGIFTAMLLSALITFATTATFSKALIVIVALIGIHALDSNILLPTVVGSKVKINAFVTVLGVFIGEMIWGIPGMFLSIPIIAVMKIVFDRVDELKPWGMLLGEETKK
ncbi:AI-2E family transporter [Pseudopedobacter saltans]|nr:AI-2E family transporter [Pseudopedobacter saltans]